MTPIIKLLEYAQEQTAKGNDFFFSYSGHIDGVSIHGHHGKWHVKSCQFTNTGSFSCKISELTDEKADYWIASFNHRLEQGI